MFSRRQTQIRRDYSQPFFGRRRRSTGPIIILLLLIAIVLLAVNLQFDRLQYVVLDSVGMAPTPTLYASQHADKGLNMFHSGDVRGAESELAIAISQQPNNVDYLYEYGQILIEMVELDYATDARLDEVIILADRIITVAPSDPRGYALKARALQWSAPADAIPVAITGTEQDTNFVPLHSTLAIAYTNIGRYQKGLEEGLQAVTLGPNDANARRAYSWTLLNTGRYDQAIEQLEMAINLNPNITSPYFEMASLYRILNQPEAAVGILLKVTEIDPFNPKSYLRICETYMSVGEFRGGEPYCEQALDIDPNYGSAHRALGQIQYARRNYESAITSFETCVNLGATDIECWYLRGWSHYFLAQCDAAWEVLNGSLQRAVSEEVIDRTRIGLDAVIQNCSGYQEYSLPTPIPPTPIPPTPIGGF